MNINTVKEKIASNRNRHVIISEYGMRNRMTRYEGIIKEVYPNIFTIEIKGEEKSFPYRDVITGDIKIKYL